MLKTEREKMLAHEPYIGISDPELIAMMAAAQELLHTFNFSHPNDIKTRRQIVRNLFGSIGGQVDYMIIFG